MGNKIIGSNCGANIEWNGDNSIIEIGDNCELDALTIKIYSDVHVTIGNNVRVAKECTWSFMNCSKARIGDYVSFNMDGAEILVGLRSELFVGEKTVFNKNNWILMSADTKCTIGKYSLFSRNVTIRTDDGHHIFDVNTGEIINKGPREVIIGEHVWLGQDVFILYNTNIGSGSIVGARSLIKGAFPNNCIIVGIGSDARVIKRDVAWIRDDRGLGIEAVPSQWKVKTDSQESKQE